jgi:hypothetical protein
VSLALVCMIGVYHRFHYCAENWEEDVRILLRFAWWVFLISSISLQEIEKRVRLALICLMGIAHKFYSVEEIEKRVWVLLWYLPKWVFLINSIFRAGNWEEGVKQKKREPWRGAHFHRVANLQWWNIKLLSGSFLQPSISHACSFCINR